MIPAYADVLRDSVRRVIPATMLIPGDFVFLKTGDKVPADIRLVICDNIKTDNSSLTGESEPQERSLMANYDSPMEAQNIVFNGTLIVNGDGAGIAIRIGDSTVLGQIAKLTLSGEKRTSQLVNEIDFFVKVLATVAVITTVIFFLIGLARGYSITTNFTFAIGVFVSFVPEGLPLTVSILLTLAAKRLTKKNVLVKDLHGVETLGSITLLATDKTGTLTQNRMTVANVWLNACFYDLMIPLGISKIDFVPSTDLHEKAFFKDVSNRSLLIQMYSLCSKCKVDATDWDKPIGERNIFGDATESGLFRYAMQESDVSYLLEKHSKLCEISFSSDTKWHLTVHDYESSNGHFVVFLKGAPERVLAKCSKIMIDDLVQSIKFIIICLIFIGIRFK
jgi:sodium/potassium-transporting ATPase subunit alpha